MAADGMLSGHVALNYADLKAFNDSGELSPSVFFSKRLGRGQYIPLDTTVEAAVETAFLHSTSTTFQTVEHDTTWYVLKVVFSEGSIARMFMIKELNWSSNGQRLQLSASIKSEWLRKASRDSPHLEVIEVPLSQMSVDDWGDRVLSVQFRLRELRALATCQQCSEAGRRLWKSPSADGHKYYCAGCWHAHCRAAPNVCGSLHEVQQKRLAAGESRSKAGGPASDASAEEAQDPGAPSEADTGLDNRGVQTKGDQNDDCVF